MFSVRISAKPRYKISSRFCWIPLYKQTNMRFRHRSDGFCKLTLNVQNCRIPNLAVSHGLGSLKNTRLSCCITSLMCLEQFWSDKTRQKKYWQQNSKWQQKLARKWNRGLAQKLGFKPIWPRKKQNSGLELAVTGIVSNAPSCFLPSSTNVPVIEIHHEGFGHCYNQEDWSTFYSLLLFGQTAELILKPSQRFVR